MPTTDNPLAHLPPHVQHPTVIGLCGAAGSGKTTAANWFLRNHVQVLKMAFASPIRIMIYEMMRDTQPKNADPNATFYLNDGKDAPIPWLGGVTCRRLMQTLGTDWGRNTIHPDLWAGIAATRLEARMTSSYGKSTATTLRAVFDDLRFANEAEMVRAAGGCVVRLVRPGEGHRPSVTYEHASEQQEFDADLTIVNDGDEETLFAMLARSWPPTIQPKADKTTKLKKTRA